MKQAGKNDFKTVNSVLLSVFHLAMGLQFYIKAAKCW